MLLFVIAHFKKPNAIFNVLLICIFLALNAVSSMLMTVQLFRTIIKALKRKKLWSAEYQKMSVRTSCIVYLAIIIYCDIAQHVLFIWQPRQRIQIAIAKYYWGIRTYFHSLIIHRIDPTFISESNI
jgi:hypothetical protein